MASAASRLRRQARYEEAARLREVGATITRISAELGADRKTVHGWLTLGQAPAWAQPSGDSILDPFKTFLGRRWSEGCRNSSQLWRELLTLGFRGRPSIVRDWAAGHRGGVVREDGSVGQHLPPTWPVPTGYRLARLRRDFDAISAALVTPWTTSPVEGQISRLKLMPIALARGVEGFFVGVLVHRCRTTTDKISTWILLALLVVAAVIPKVMGSHWGLNYGMRLSLGLWPLLLLLSLRGYASRLLNTSPLQKLGDLSYSIYLVHMPIIMIVMGLHGGGLFTERAFFIAAPIVLIATLLVASASFRWLESPSRRWINAFVNGESRRTEAADVF